jgi:hypothetical protein
MRVRDDELVLLSRLRIAANVSVDAEVARRNVAASKRNEEALRLNREAVTQNTAATIEALGLNREATDQSTAALVAFKQQSAVASDRLETLTKWLIVFTITLAVLTVALVVHDLTR